MIWLTKTLFSSVGKKILMALTGLFLILFLVEHLVGNFLLFAGDGGESFNAYSEYMQHNVLIRTVEILLFLAIILHVLDALRLTKENRKARPSRYIVNQPAENSTWFSRNMGMSGSIVFVFLVLHLRTFFVGVRLLGDFEGDMYAGVVNAFSHAWYAGFYVAAMVLLCFHLMHGFSSAFQTLGLNHKKYTPFIIGLGVGFSVLVSAGFASMPVYFYFMK